MTAFGYDPAIINRFPQIRGGVIYATELSNGPSPDSLHETYTRDQTDVLAAMGDTPLSEIPSLSAWRRAFTSFGVKPTQYRSAAESLLRRLTKQGSIPSINTLVDIANLISIRYRIPVAAFDQSPVKGVTTVRFATGEERFTDLGSGTTTNPAPGEVVFVDDAGLASARRWCWRQSVESAAGPNTAAAIFTIEGQHESAAEDIQRAIADLIQLLVTHQEGAEVASGLLSPSTPWFEFPLG